MMNGTYICLYSVIYNKRNDKGNYKLKSRLGELKKRTEYRLLDVAPKKF